MSYALKLILLLFANNLSFSFLSSILKLNREKNKFDFLSEFFSFTTMIEEEKKNRVKCLYIK